MTAPVPPPRPTTPRDICWAGVTPCGKPAQLYPCGPRCTDHAPNHKEHR